MGDLVNKEYLSKQFAGYSTVVKEQLDKKIDVQQNVSDKNKLLGIGEDGKVVPVEAPSSVKVSAESDNQIEQKTDGIYVKDMSSKISAEEGNAITEKNDGLYVPTTAETKVSEAEGNTIEVKDDGIYVAPTDLDDYSTTDEVKELIKDELYTENTIPAHYEIADTSTPNALEVVADGTATDGQIDLSNVVDIGANIGDFVVFVDEITTTDTKYAEKADTYTKSEVDQKITDAVTNGTVDLSGYTTDDELSDALADYTKTTDLETQLEDYVLDSDMEIIDLATLESMLGLSTEELEGLASLLSDTTIQIDKTWSSSKIYSELNTTLDSAKQYTLDELSKAIGASYKVVTSVDQMTDSKVLYLLKDADSGMYNIYVYDADTSTAELIGSFEINLDDYYTKRESEDLFATKADLVANYATKQEVVDGYATKTELQDAIADVEVEISETENNQIQTLEDGLFVDSETVTISKADYDALSIEEKSNGKIYFVPDDETTEDGTDLTQFAKVSDLEETNSKIEEINDSLAKSIITFTPNSEYVVTNYTYCRKSGNIVMLNVDLTYNVDAQYTEYVVGTIDSNFPESTVFNVILNGDGGKIQLCVRPSGEVMIETGDSTVGINSRVRYQLMWIV